MKYILLLASVLITQLSFSQEYIINLKGDTLRGEIIIELPNDNFDEVLLKTDNDKIRLKAYQFLSIVKDSTTYKPVKYAEKYHLMKLISDGYLSHYQFRNGTYDFGINFLLKVDGDGMEVPNLSFKKGVSDFVSECPELSKKIADKELIRKDLNQIITEYNNCIDRNTVKTQSNITNTVKTESPTIKLLENLKSQISTDKEELLTLIKDISAKIAAGKTVPSYLTSALKDQTSEMPELKEKVDKIVEALK